MEVVKSQNVKILKYILIIFLGSILLTISSKIKIPFYPVPMTMQTFVVLFLGMSFGYKIGLATVSLYLIEGIIGLPVFSNSPEKGVGLVYFTGPTMGYLIGFLIATFLAGYFKFEGNLLKKIQTKIVKFEVDKKVNINNNSLKSINILSNKTNELVVSFEKNTLNVTDVIKFLNNQNIKLLDISTDDGDLEDVFLRLTKN